jgi:hypothetical protein
MASLQFFCRKDPFKTYCLEVVCHAGIAECTTNLRRRSVYPTTLFSVDVLRRQTSRAHCAYNEAFFYFSVFRFSLRSEED